MSAPSSVVAVRPARTQDVPTIQALLEPLVVSRVLLGKELVTLYESIQEFLVAEEVATGQILGFGALHVFWEDLAEVRTLAVDPEWTGHGVGRQLVLQLQDRALALGVTRLFCLTFETEFFEKLGFREVSDRDASGRVVDAEVTLELVRSSDEGIAEFLELARVKQNTLGNTRMLKRLAP